MSKIVGNHDQIHLILNGHWTWNDTTHDLEYHFGTPNIGGRVFGQGRQSRVPGQRSPIRTNIKHSGEHTHVTLDYVKALALNMLSEVEVVSRVFDGLYNTDQFDEFLLFLMNYFHWFFEKRTHEQKPNPMNIEPSLSEVKYYEDLCAKLEAAQKQLGKAYCVLVLGIGLFSQHHMACGMSRVSSTYKDRSMYETFYSFCTFLVWIAFRRREYEVVKKEIGRMLRSDTFNPAIRVKNAPSDKPIEEKKEGADDKDKKVKLTPAEYRRCQGKRPPIKSIINSLAKAEREELSEEALEEQFAHLNIDVSKLKVGIIGQPLSQFNPMTLTPIDADNEEDNRDEGESSPTPRRESHAVSMGKTPQPAGDASVSRQATAISQVTTDALPDDE
ncbi:hypothetical protein LSH36_324g01008 [Paralvinella palmiformis]|uniref:Protein phosphatase 1 regulatory subunit 36 n=1 Tax=Paralvinella palmiformis TaxID=53620 RepID=A0AAD9JGN9_9ANNE|nr:hypothetical protein LSH36_324g01008 [Paralvinella palmiformis]